MKKANSSFPTEAPRRILMLKGYSAGVGDLLRSSVAWRGLHEKFPQAQLHLWFLTQDPGSPSEQLIARHHLLASFHVSDKRTRGLEGWIKLLRDAKAIVNQVRPDLIVDFEPNGLRTSLLALLMGRWARAATIGIAQNPGRRFFYTQSSPSTKIYAAKNGMTLPLEYCERDFVALAALGIERRGAAIELKETDEGRAFRARLREELGGDSARPLLGLNIGCGTPDAIVKRPDLDLLAGLVGELQRRHGFAVVLTGAQYEREINCEFISRLHATGPVVDLAGRTDMLELAGAIAACQLFVSSDSGPYHMAVALRVPTLAIFKFPNPQHYHRHAWVECVVAPNAKSLPVALAAAERLLKITPPPLPA
jgi:ADP-heptose:LPS heptosyltransferase